MLKNSMHVKPIRLISSGLILLAASAAMAQTSVIGKWTGHYIPDGKPHPKAIQQAVDQAAKSTVDLEINKDGSFLYKLPDSLKRKLDHVNGTWKLTGSTLELYWPKFRKGTLRSFLILTVDQHGKKLLGAKGPAGHEVFVRD